MDTANDLALIAELLDPTATVAEAVKLAQAAPPEPEPARKELTA